MVSDDEGADVAAFGFGDEALDEDVLFRGLEGFDDRFGDLGGFGEDDADALGALEDLDDDGRAPMRLIAGRTSFRSRTKVVWGMPMSWRERIWRERSLSRELEMPAAVLGV